MSEWYDTRSAEVILRQPRSWSNERNCLDGCLKHLKPRELELIQQIVGDQRERNDLAVFLRVPASELKKIRSRLSMCINKCLEKAKDKAFPG